MAVAHLFFPEEIATWWRDLFRDSTVGLKAELGLVEIKAGSLMEFPNPTPANLASIVPAVYVMPATFTNSLETVNGRVYRTQYRMRVAYFGHVPENAAAPTIESERSKIRRFADAIVTYRQMAGAPIADFAQSNVQIEIAIPTQVPLRPEEDKIVAAVNGQIVAAALDLVVDALTASPT